MKNRKGFCFARFFSNPISNLFAKNGYYTMQLFSTSTAENRIFAQAIPDRWVHGRQWLSSNYEHKQGVPSSTQAVYQMWRNASTWNIKTGWKNPWYLPIFLWMRQLSTSVVCQRICCNSFVERICCDLTYIQPKNKSIGWARKREAPVSLPKNQLWFLSAFAFRQGQPFRFLLGIASAVFLIFQFHRNRSRCEYSCDPCQYAAYKCPFAAHFLAPICYPSTG